MHTLFTFSPGASLLSPRVSYRAIFFPLFTVYRNSRKIDKENEMEFLFDLYDDRVEEKESTTRETSRIEIPRKNSVDRF